MPSDVNAELPRFVVDEASFDFRELSDAAVEDGLDQFNDTLGALLRQGRLVGINSRYWEIECRDGCGLCDFLYVKDTCEVDRDTLILCGTLLDRCVDWNDRVPDACIEVRVDGTKLPTAFSVGFALTMALRRRGVACLVFPHATRRGFRPVTGDVGEADVFFFADPGALPGFWRHLYELEDVPEHGFFTLAADAFPELVLHPDLTFKKFAGTYLDLRSRVVSILGALNDHLPRIVAEQRGDTNRVEAAMRPYGFGFSPENPRTHANKRHMSLRDVTYDGQTYRCEWHAKIEPHRNRIHLTLPAQGPDGRILIGIFVKHLDT